MTALIIVACTALVLFILLASYIRAELEFDGETFRIKVKYLFVTIVKVPKTPEEKAKAKEKKEKKEAAKKKKADAQKNGEKPAQKSENKTAGPGGSEKTAKKPSEKPKFSFDLIKRILGRASPHIKRIFKKIRFREVWTDIIVGGEDAAKTAISYGAHCALIDGVICLLDNYFDFQAEKISIRADFQREKTLYKAGGRVKLRLSTLLHSGIWGFFAVMSELKKDAEAIDSNNKKAGKAA